MSQISLVAANLFKWVAHGPISIDSIFGYNNNASVVYIQLHQSPPPAPGTGNIANGTVPAIKSLACAANAPFAFTIPMDLKECFLALSSTEATLTAVGAGAGLDLTMLCSSDFLCTGNEVVVGDLTTGVNTLQVWTQANGATHRYALLRLDIYELLGHQQWAAIVSTDAVPTVVPPFDQILSIPNNFSYSSSASMGSVQTGSTLFTQTAAKVYTLGCSIFIFDSGSTVAPYATPLSTLTQTAGAATIRAIYTTLS